MPAEIVIEIMFAPNYMVQTSQVFETCEVSDELNKKRHERLWRNPTNNKSVQATGAIRGGGVVLNPRTPMRKNTLPNFSYRMARIIASLAEFTNNLIQYRPHVMDIGRLSKALAHHRLGLFCRIGKVHTESSKHVNRETNLQSPVSNSLILKFS